MKLYKRQPFIFEKIGVETLIIDHKKGTLITLNHSASFLWENLQKPISEKTLSLRFIDHYGKDKSQDLKQGLKKLLKAGIMICLNN